MKYNIAAFILLSMVTVFSAVAQEKASPLELSGSVDTYYKYDFNKSGNIATFFANEQNSVSLGMIDLTLKKTTGKASFVGELSFGPRGQYQTIPDASGGYTPTENGFNIQNLYVNYAFSDQFSLTAGYMGTFIGYEVISPAANFHYSTSYLFGSGPFQNAGIKGTYTFSDKVSLMVGLFNEWNQYQASRGVSSVGGQLALSPVKGLIAYLNGLHGLDGYGNYSTVLDLTANYEITDKLKLGVNAADLSADENEFGYSGVALYPQYSVSPSVALGLRGEFFHYKGVFGASGSDITSITFSANVKSGGLTFIPEIRFDNDKDLTQGFTTKAGTMSKNASQFSLAAVYSF